MAYKVIIKEQAKDDTQAAYDHYEEQFLHLGEEFLLERFPYVVVFEIIEESVII